MEKDICTASAQKGTSAGLARHFLANDQLTALDVMRYGVVSIDKQEPLHRAVQLLLEHKISGLPVTHAGSLAGVLSDILRHRAAV